MRKILTDDVVKQYCLNELGFKNAASNKSIFNGYSKLASKSYAMTAPSQNSVDFYNSISQSPLINSVDLIQNLKRSDANVYIPENFTRADNLQKFADLSESPENGISTPENQNESGPSERPIINPMYGTMSPLARRAIFKASMPPHLQNLQPSVSPARLNEDDDDNDISEVEYLGVEVSPLATRAQRARAGNQL